jgi:adsorption protein B
VVGDRLGPTTKADCLNRIWHALLEDEVRARVAYKAIVLHDAEDVVHSGELKLFDTLIERFDLVQLPVLPLIDQQSRWISGHYCDEFAEAHGKQLVVREAIGALSRAAIGRIADAGDGDPFDADSLTEDYEIGLKLGDFGMRGIFVRLPAAGGKALVAVRAYFPATLATAVRQKTRWLTGIALSGWDRLGWSGGLAESWMRLRDRRAVLAAVILATAYAALVLEVTAGAWRYALDLPVVVPVGPGLALLLQINLVLMAWRIAMRVAMVRQAYGWAEACSNMSASAPSARRRGTRPATSFRTRCRRSEGTGAAAAFPSHRRRALDRRANDGAELVRGRERSRSIRRVRPDGWGGCARRCGCPACPAGAGCDRVADVAFRRCGAI